MTQALSALLANLEAATGPSRELDAKIARAVGWRERDGMLHREWISPAHRVAELPFFTKSLDAAMTLVPEGDWSGEIMWRFGDAKNGGFVELNLANPEWLKPDCDPSQQDAHAACVNSYEDQEPDQHAPRPLALALVIASIRARLAGQKE